MRRPTASFMLLTYNQRPYVDAALAGALGQDFAPLEIIISDDGSNDGTYERLKEGVAAYRGSHKVHLLPRDRNRGWTANLNRTFSHATGELLVIAAGDDESLPERTSRLVKKWHDLNRAPVALFSSYLVTDANDKVTGRKDYSEGPHNASLKSRIWGGIPVEGASAAYERSVFFFFGPIRYRAINEDVILQFRAALLGGVFTVADSLVRYRKWHGGQSFIETLAATPETESRNEQRRLSRVVRCLFNFRRDARQLASSESARASELNLIRAWIDVRIREMLLRRALLSAALPKRIRNFTLLSRLQIPIPHRFRDLLYALHPGSAFRAKLFYRRLRVMIARRT